jgi:CheY-like chemotaxis protein
MTAQPILVVDDNPINLKLMRIVLSAEGYAVTTASDGDEALALLAGFRPLLIVMDIQMPGLDGLTLTRRLKADPGTRDIIIVATTAYAMKGDQDRAFAAGCDGYLTKPIDTRALPGIIAGFIDRAPQARRP